MAASWSPDMMTALDVLADKEPYHEPPSQMTSAVSPFSVAAVKALRRKSDEIWGVLSPLEGVRRQAIANEEALARYQLQTSRYQSVQAGVRIDSEEASARSILQFTERTARRTMNRYWSNATTQCSDTCNPLAPPLSPSESVVHGSPPSTAASPTSPSSAASFGGQGRRRTIGGTQTVSNFQKQFLAAMDDLERLEQSGRAFVRRLEVAFRHHLSSHSFFNEYYEYEFHLFDNVPRVPADSAAVRSRAMLMLHEWRARTAIEEEWEDRFCDFCKVLSPFIPPLVNQLEWKDLLTRYFNEHFHYLENTWRSEELYERDVIMERFREETVRVLASVHAYVVLQEPTKRRAIRREERRHWSSLMAHEHPRITEIRNSHMRSVMRRCFRKLVGLRAYRTATINQHERILVMESLALEKIRLLFLQRWRLRVLHKRQLGAIESNAREQRNSLGLRYLRTWSEWSCNHVRRRFLLARLQRRTAEVTQHRVKQLFSQWRSFRLLKAAQHLEEANTNYFLRRMATRWFWGCWRLKRRKQHRVKFYKMERMAQLWRLDRTMQSWGRNGFLALRKARREKHEELATMLQGVQQSLMQRRWRAWKFFLKRRKQGRLSLKLEQINNNYTKIRRMATWMALTSVRNGVRKVNCLIVRLMPQFIAPWFDIWRRVVGRRNRAIANHLLVLNQERMVVCILPSWQRWAHRHRYVRLVKQEGQLDLLTKRNAFRYFLQRFTQWMSEMLQRKRAIAVGLMRGHAHIAHMQLTFHQWKLFRVRKPQVEHLCRIHRRATATLLRGAWRRWARLIATKGVRQDKQRIADSLERRNVRIRVTSVLRRFSTRCMMSGNNAGRGTSSSGDNRLSRFQARVEADHSTRRWLKWTRWIQFRKDTAVASNLEVVNADRWRHTVWHRWQRAARCLSRQKQILSLLQRNEERYRRLVWQRVVCSKWYVHGVIVGSLRDIRLVADVRCMMQVFGAWVRHARTWKRSMLAETLRQANAKILLQRYFTMFCNHHTSRAVWRVFSLSFSLAGDVAGRRYYRRWVAVLRRKVHLRVNVTALTMLGDSWSRRNAWILWLGCIRKFIHHHNASSTSQMLPSNDPAHHEKKIDGSAAQDRSDEGVQVSLQQQARACGAREFLRRLREMEKTANEGGRRTHTL